MKRIFKVVPILMMFFCFMLSTKSVKAEAMIDEGHSDYVSISNITANSAYIDWSAMYGVAVNKASLGDYDVKNVSYKVIVGDNTYYESTTLTSLSLTGITPDTCYFVEVYMYYTEVSRLDETETFDTYDYEWESFTTGELSNIASSDDSPTPVPTPSVTPVITPTYEPTYTADTTSLSTPNISKVIMCEGTVTALADNVDTNNVTALEWMLFDAKTGKCIVSDTSYSTREDLYNVNKRKVFYLQCRAVSYDSNSNYIYSNWSSPKYFVSQPKVSIKKKNIKKNSITVKWKKVTGAKNYTIYARKRNAKKWTKIKTTSKTSYTIRKLKGKIINVWDNDYEITIVSNTRINGKTLKSGKNEYYYTYLIL